MKKLCSYKLESHPGIPLIQHLEHVGNRCESILKNKEINFSYSKDKLIFVVKVMGYTHDLGKATAFFQQYLKEMTDNGSSTVDKDLRSHGYLSALFTYLQLKKIDENIALLAFIIVRKHHGDLDNIDIECAFSSIDKKSRKKILKKQLESIDYKEFNNIIKELPLQEVKEEEVLEALEQVSEEAEELEENIESNQDLEDYLLYKFLYSLLIFSDKEDAIFHAPQDIVYDIPFDIVDKYKKLKFKGEMSKLDKVRNDIYDDVINSIRSVPGRIMSITVPTGTGKTLTALAAALNLKDVLKTDMRIIYCLPFTSIIDQNFDVYNDIIKKVMGEEKCTSDRVLKHHHLSDFNYSSETKNFDGNESKFLTENWNSQIVVTTFMQFFNVMFSNHNSQLVKYQSLANSIVLLDEIQSIPYKYWLIINKMLQAMAEKLNIYFILITATQPLIFNKGEINELVPKSEDYFKIFKRTKLHINLDKIDIDEFLDKIQNLIEGDQQKNILIILNTVRVTQTVFKTIKNMELENTEIYFLSTGIVPKERRIRIDDIKKSKQRKIVVSTQLIEAGVDIDMDVVVRDMATLDSINQSAGRCNREYRGEYLGDVYICNLDNSFIYDKLLIDKTKEILNGKTIIYEEDYLKLNDYYFNLVSNDMSKDNSKKLITSVNALKFKDISNDFKLIDVQQKVSLFIECDGEAASVWNKYKEILKEKDPFNIKEKFQNIKKDFYDHVITVFKNKAREEADKGIVFVPNDALCGVYDQDTGYILKDKDVVL